MIDAPLALAFTTGMVVTVNPCGFAMLPAYLSFFVGVDDDRATLQAVGRAVVVGAAVTGGFVATFAVFGIVISQLTAGVYRVAPWLSLLIGLALVVFGLVLVAGWETKLRLPRLDRGGGRRTVGSMALFGVSYAVASCGCTLPLFVATMSTVFGRGVPSGVAYFVAYALGFGLIITTLTVALAFAKSSFVAQMRRVLPLVNRVAGAVLVLTGLYIVHYGWVEIGQGRTQSIPDSPIVSTVNSWSSVAQNWIADRRDLLPVVLVLVLALIVFSAWYLRQRGSSHPSTTSSDAASADWTSAG